MAGFSKKNAEQLRATLQNAAVRCSERCLYQSAKWAAELSVSLSPHFDDSDGSETDVDSPMQDAGDAPPMLSTIISASSDADEARLEYQEFHKFLLAKSYFDCREFERCAAVFVPSGLPRGPLSTTSPNSELRNSLKGKSKLRESGSQGVSKGPGVILSHDALPRISKKSLFMALYAKYMSGEKRKDEESEMILGPADRGAVMNKELVSISRSLENHFAADGPDKPGDGWLEYLYGIVLAKGKNEEDARKWLIKSVHIFPYNWGAWLELNDLIGSVDELQSILLDLPQNLMTLVFNVFSNQELYQSTEQTHDQLNSLETVFPESQFLRTQRALLFYHSKDFDEAESVFSAILQADPHRIDSLDHYSNILYVMGARPKLAFVAQLATATDKFRPETCCIVGNYYSLKSEHEKAVQYFRRALTLDRNFLSAWTLMGHEYVEMKNTHAAIESYRRAVDVNRKDYRAWYGLGQTYEVLEMSLYALFYYQRAASLRPYDPKMWQAVGSCYDKVGRPTQSIKAYKRALVAGTYYDSGSSFGSGATNSEPPNGVMNPDTLYSIALMYEKLNDMDQASSYMEMTLAQEDGTNGNDEDDEEGGKPPGTGVTHTTSKARIWLAKWEFRRGRFSKAMELANELCQDGVDVEEAKALIRDIRARIDPGETSGLLV